MKRKPIISDMEPSEMKQKIQRNVIRKVENSILRGYVSCDVKRLNKATEYELNRRGHEVTEYDEGYSIKFYT